MAANKPAVDHLLASLQRDLNSVTDADRSLRRRAFDSLRKRLLDGPDAPDAAVLSDLLPALFPTLLRGFTDNVEKVREKSADERTSSDAAMRNAHSNSRSPLRPSRPSAH